MKTRVYLVSVVCSDATTHSVKMGCETRKEADKFAQGVESVLVAQGKNIYLNTVKFVKQ